MEGFCKLCHVGAVQRKVDTWARIVGPYLVTLPGIEVLVCDACGLMEYDTATLNLISATLRCNSLLSDKQRGLSSPDRLDSDRLRYWASRRT